MMILRYVVWPLIGIGSLLAATSQEPLSTLLATPRYGPLLQQGRRALEVGRAELAAADFRQALDRMDADHLPPTLLFPVRMALTTAYLQSDDLRRADQTLLEATRSQSRTNDDLVDAELANNWACLHLKQSRVEQARMEFTEVLNRVARNPSGWQVTPSVLENLAITEIRLGLYREALSHQQEALRRWKIYLPATHINLIKAYTSLATIQYRLNDPAAAGASMRMAIDTGRQSLGDRSPLMAKLLRNYAIVLRRLNKKREAKAFEVEASRISPPETGPLTVDTQAMVLDCRLGCSQSLR
jgi:tetratricopeptide (TPR) repeat protein